MVQDPLFLENSPSVTMEMVFRLKIKDVMQQDVHSVSAEQAMRCVREIMREKQISAMPVLDGERLCGIVSMKDLLDALDEQQLDKPVTQYMSKVVVALEEDMPLTFAINYMDKYSFSHFPVLNKNKRLMGVIGNRDIVNKLLAEMNSEMAKLEQRIDEMQDSSAERCQEQSQKLQFLCRRFDFENAGKASTEIKKLLKKRGIERSIIRRIAVASYELEINIVIHSQGGAISFHISEEAVEITARDCGPGIPKLESAMEEGFSTAGDWIRSLGFGAGMGLPNIRRVSDEFHIQSSVDGDIGTVVTAKIYLKKEAN